MKRKLLQKEDYLKLMKMSQQEIVRFLEESHYKKAIDDLALTLKGSDLIEAALNRSLADEFSKMRRISDSQTKFVLDAYLQRWDVANVKTVLRIAQSKSSIEKAENFIIAAGKYPKEFFLNLLKLQGVEDIIKQLSFVDAKERERLLASYSQTKSILQLESMLDSQYYAKMQRRGKRLGSESMLFKRFLSDEVAIINLKLIIRLRSEGMDSNELKKYLITKEGVLDAKLQSVLGASTVESSIEQAQKMFAKFLSGMSGQTVMDAELECDRYLIENYASAMYMNPFSITPLLTVMFVKAAEVQNIKGLIKAKELGFDQKFIEEKVIVPCWR